MLPVSAPDPCPVRCLGQSGGALAFTSPLGRTVAIMPDDLARTDVLRQLFDGQESWLRRQFPAQTVVVAEITGGGRIIPLGFDALAAATWLMQACLEAERAAPPPVTDRPERGWWSRTVARWRAPAAQPAHVA